LRDDLREAYETKLDSFVNDIVNDLSKQGLMAKVGNG
jgi:hypothetical protein